MLIKDLLKKSPFLLRKARKFRRSWLTPSRPPEIAVYLNARLRKYAKPETRFIVYGCPRSGTTLLGGLLDCSPQIQWDVEKFRRRVRRPLLFTEGLSYGRGKPCYGVKLFVHQLVEGTHVCESAFLGELHRRGWKIINVKRLNLLERVISFLRHERFRKKKAAGETVHIKDKVTICCDELLERLQKEERLSRIQDELLQDLPHFEVIYERDLLEKRCHQKTLDRVFTWLGVPSVPVHASLQKSASNDLREDILNYDDLLRALDGTQYAAYLKTNPIL